MSLIVMGNAKNLNIYLDVESLDFKSAVVINREV